MATRKIMIGLAVGILLTFLAVGAPAQVNRQFRTGGSTRSVPPNQQEMQRQFDAKAEAWKKQAEMETEKRKKQMIQEAAQRNRDLDRQRDEAIRTVLGAGEEEWKTIYPKFNRLRDLVQQSRCSINIVTFSAFGGSGGSVQTSGSNSGSPVKSGGTMRSASGGSGGGVVSGGSTSGVIIDGKEWKPTEDPNGTSTGTWSKSGWKWTRPSDKKKAEEMSAVERAAESLLNTLEKGSGRQDEIQKKLALLREGRDAAAKQLPEAQKELRELLTDEQQAMVVLMGYLD